jgi:hypothetical protein
MKTVPGVCVLVLSVCLLGLSADAQDSPAKSAQRAAETWLGHVDAGQYAASWQEASAYLQGAVTAIRWTMSLNGVRKPLGQVVSRVCPTFYTSGNSASCGPFSRKSATSKERDFIAW